MELKSIFIVSVSVCTQEIINQQWTLHPFHLLNISGPFVIIPTVIVQSLLSSYYYERNALAAGKNGRIRGGNRRTTTPFIKLR